ncbi:MAG: molybdopterin molybdotransferase MoeA [Bacillota bacterium]
MKTKKIKLRNSWGRRLADDFFAPRSLPFFDYSLVDGYGFNSKSCLEPRQVVSLQIEYKLNAGDFLRCTVESGQAVKIMTGAAVPPGVDVVLKTEDVLQVKEDKITFKNNICPGQNIKQAGSLYRKDDLLLRQGTILTAENMALLASFGLEYIQVLSDPEVAIVSTGSELIEPGEDLKPGKIYNSNAYFLRGKLQEIGLVPRADEVVSDELKAISQILLKYIPETDVIISTGGLGQGDKDLMGNVLAEIDAEIKDISSHAKSSATYILAYKDDTKIFALSGKPTAVEQAYKQVVYPKLLNFYHI